MTVYKVRIKSAVTPYVWYHDKIGEVFEAVPHKTDSLFWFPGDVYQTAYGYVHTIDAEIIEEKKSLTDPIQNN